MPTSDADDMLRFEDWMKEHHKKYDSEAEKEKRFKVFQKNLRKIEAHNAVPNQSYWKGLNDCSDITPEEFRRDIMGYTGPDSDETDEDEMPPVPVKRKRGCCITAADTKDDVPVAVKRQRGCCITAADNKDDVLVAVKRQRGCCITAAVKRQRIGCDEKDTKEDVTVPMEPEESYEAFSK